MNAYDRDVIDIVADLGQLYMITGRAADAEMLFSDAKAMVYFRNSHIIEWAGYSIIASMVLLFTWDSTTRTTEIRSNGQLLSSCRRISEANRRIF